ncbi:hypothetical protein F4861DRAFT_435826 [Xylaria intraflava]|nr:hypothetical protein F4861DRAFT_435826 [Xylaria intraflava]
MKSRVNTPGRPTLAPLWTGGQKSGHSPETAFRTVQGPLLSPSPMSPETALSSAQSPSSSDGFILKKDRALLDSLSHQSSPASLTSPKSLTSIEGQSPLVSRLEEVSLQLADTGKRRLPKSPLAHQSGPNTVRARNKVQRREGDGNTITADAFIIARSIRRKGDSNTGTSQPSLSQTEPEADGSHRMTIRAFIRPKSSARQNFVIQRTLNMDEVRVKVPISAAEKSPQSASPSGPNRTPLPVGAKRSLNSRQPSTGLSQSQARRPSKPLSHPTDYDNLINDPKAVPIHLKYAVSALPVLAVLLMSGHVRTGDIIYLPVPHAESWPQTVRYVYTGRGELTAAMRENITYLGGRV